jgi:hypothetical protein
MEHSPFTGISITQDNHCNVHTDSNDFSYSFFVWLGANGTLFFIISFFIISFFITSFFITSFFITSFSSFGSLLCRDNY